MPDCHPLPAAFTAWLARRLAAGADPAQLAAEHGLAADRLALAGIGEAALPPDAFEREAGGDATERRALLEAAIDALLAQGRPLEAARLVRLAARPSRRAEAAPLDPAQAADEQATVLAQLRAELTPEERAEWDALGYEHWVVPPGSGRRPLASLTAEWVCAADRWRVLEELARVSDPAERARVLDHFRRAGLDPGADHPAFAGAVDLPPEAVGVAAAAVEASGTEAEAAAPEPPAGRDPAFHALLVRMGLEAEAYHAAGRARRAALAWQRHACELGVPVPAHADLGSLPSAPVRPSTSGPAAPAAPAGSGETDPAAWPRTVRPRPPEPEGPGWPWAPQDGVSAEALAERAARAPRPAPAGRATVPRPPPPPPPPPRAGLPPPAAPPPVAWAPEPLSPTRLAKLRGDWPWWCQ